MCRQLLINTHFFHILRFPSPLFLILPISHYRLKIPASAFSLFRNITVVPDLSTIKDIRSANTQYNNTYLHPHINNTTAAMPSIKQILVSLAFATAVAAQAASQIADGQVQQISDGQVQAPTSVAPVTQITDGQIQAPTSAPAVTQITDGQIQAPTSVAPVTQITDGQIQAPTSVAPVTQITDGQIQVPTTAASTGVVPPSSNGTFTSPAPTAAFTGAAALFSWSQEIVVAAVGAAAGIAML